MGELLVRGPTSAMMYWNNREQSRSTFLGEWTRSGDKYVEDQDGYFVYCGRRDDMLKVSGQYVSPFEVEAALQTHSDVLEAAVVAWPDGDGLIKPKAFVVLKSREKATDPKASDAMSRTLQDHVKAKLAPYKYPRWIEFRERFAEDRNRQDPALQIARRGAAALRSSQRPFRRTDMRTALLAAARIVALATTPALAQQKTVKIGFVSTFSGPAPRSAMTCATRSSSRSTITTASLAGCRWKSSTRTTRSSRRSAFRRSRS